MYICITNRHLCQADFLEKIDLLAKKEEIEKIILREKDLSLSDYEKLAEKCSQICRHYEMPFIVNHHISAAKNLGIQRIQVSIDILKKDRKRIRNFSETGVSVHTLNEAKEAEYLGASYLIAGHIFATDCKKGVLPRGVGFLEEVCKAVSIPVYAIGGVKPANIQEVLEAGAKGGCMMSGFMRDA